MGKKQRTFALQVTQELLRVMGIQPELADIGDVCRALDELYYTQPQSAVYRWWVSVSERELDQFVDEWEAWRSPPSGCCAFCLGTLEGEQMVLCGPCSVLLEE